MPTAVSPDELPERHGAAERRAASGAVVLGIGRSGTSAIARAFVAAGFFAGREEDLYGAAPSNPLGHYEPLSVLELNEELLETLGCDWWSGVPPLDSQLELRAEAVPRLAAAIEALVGSAGDAPVVVKEPRVNGLLPLWEPVLEGTLHPVLAIRDPLEIALSHARRDGTPLGHALAAWEAQTALALGWVHGRPATVAPYSQLTSEPALAARVVGDAAAQLDPARAARARPQEAASGLSPELRNEEAADIDHAEYLTRRQLDLWDYLRGLPAGGAELDVPPALRQASAAAQATVASECERVRLAKAHATLVAEHAAATAGLAEIERALAETVALARAESAKAERYAAELAAVSDSASWRLTAPLRRLGRRRR